MMLLDKSAIQKKKLKENTRANKKECCAKQTDTTAHLIVAVTDSQTRYNHGLGGVCVCVMRPRSPCPQASLEKNSGPNVGVWA